MVSARVDTLARGIAARLTRRAGLGLLAGAALPWLGQGDQATARKKKKVKLCVNGATVKKPKDKAKRLLKKGATKGACSCGAGGPCTVFVTAPDFTGALGGLSGADASCTQLANAAGLPGIFQAWLSVDVSTPALRFGNSGSLGPWLLPRNATDGANPPTVANDFTDLITCGPACLQNAINRNQNGVEFLEDLLVWTGTLENGDAAPETCLGWTSGVGNDFGLFGDSSRIDDKWTDFGVLAFCNSAQSLYCFQTGT